METPTGPVTAARCDDWILPRLRDGRTKHLGLDLDHSAAGGIPFGPECGIDNMRLSSHSVPGV